MKQWRKGVHRREGNDLFGILIPGVYYQYTNLKQDREERAETVSFLYPHCA